MNGNIHVLTGNVHVQQAAVIRSNIAIGSANVNRASKAMVEGTRTALGTGFWLMLARTFCLLPLLLILGVTFLMRWLWRHRRSTATQPATATDL